MQGEYLCNTYAIDIGKLINASSPVQPFDALSFFVGFQIKRSPIIFLMSISIYIPFLFILYFSGFIYDGKLNSRPLDF